MHELSLRFRARLEKGLETNSWTYVMLPDAWATSLGTGKGSYAASGGRPRVRGFLKSVDLAASVTMPGSVPPGAAPSGSAASGGSAPIAIAGPILPAGKGRGYLVILREWREAAGGLGAGGEVDLELFPDTDYRAPEAPPELEAALDADPAVKAAFEALSPSHRKEWIVHVAEGKRAETRERRAARAAEAIRLGRGLHG